MWQCPQVHHFLNRTVKRHIERPTLWHPVVCPVPKMNLLYSQPGNQVYEAVRAMVDSSGLGNFTRYWTCSRNVKKTSEALWSLTNSYDIDPHLIVIENAQYLLQMPDLFEVTTDMENRLSSTFILVIAEGIVPKLDDFFWNQFKKHNTMLYSLPTRHHRREFLVHMWNLWAEHGHTVNISSDDYEWLTDACDFCTTTDMTLFIHRVTHYVLDSEEPIVVDRQLLESRFIFSNTGVEQASSISSVDRSTERYRYMSAIEQIQENPKGVEDVTAYLDRQKQLKRQKLEDDQLQLK